MITSKIHTVVCHKNPGSPCPDGVASAILILDACRSISAVDPEVKFVTHKTPEYEQLPATEGMIFCDIVPPPERVEEFLAVNAFVLDHHKGSKATIARFVERKFGVFADEVEEPGISGAMLAFAHVWEPIWGLTTQQIADARGRAANALRFATLAGIRDTWQKHDSRWREACAQAEALRFYPWETWSGIRSPFVHNGFEQLQSKLAIGPMLIERNEERDRYLVQNAMHFEVPSDYSIAAQLPLRACIVPSVETSDVADKLEADVVIGFAFRHTMTKTFMQLSLRSRGRFDCAAFCKVHGGGGHTQAAGCTIQLTTSDVQPFAFIPKLLKDYCR